MSLFEQWKEIADMERPDKEYNEFWNAYLEKEMKAYEQILENHNKIISGKLSELARKFNMDAPTFAGFVDGINTSLVNKVDLDDLSEDSDIKLEVEFEKLFHNMLEAKAVWLYKLTQWESVLPKDKRDQMTKEYNRSQMAVKIKIGRNDPCPCGSSKKYKKCCGKLDEISG